MLVARLIKQVHDIIEYSIFEKLYAYHLCLIAPDGYPQNLDSFTINSTAILVNWTAVPSNEQNGIIAEYLISVSSEEDFAFSMTSDSATIDDAQVFEYLFTDLEEFVEYTFVISAFTAEGKGPTSPSVSSTTDQAGT